MPLLLLFVALPLLEIAMFIAVGSKIGVGMTLLLILLSAMLGVAILRGQQSRALAMMQGALRVSPGSFLAQGAFRAVAGVLLIVPGFVTDIVALLLLVPPLQGWIVRLLGVQATTVTATMHRSATWSAGGMDGDVVEGEFTVREDAPEPLDPGHRLDDRRAP